MSRAQSGLAGSPPRSMKGWRSTTAYCLAHGELEPVGEVSSAKAFTVYEGSQKTERIAREVRAVTIPGCKVFFIGGEWWSP